MSGQEFTGHEPVPDDTLDVGRAELELEVQHLRHRVVELETSEPRRDRHTFRRIVAGILAVLTVLTIIASTVAVWMRATVFDTEEFISTVQPALESSEAAAALSTRLTDETLEALALEERIGDALADLGATIGVALADGLELAPAQVTRIQSLPIPGLEQLAGPIASGLEGRIATRIEAFVSSDRFQDLLVDLSAQAHGKAVALIRGENEELPTVVIESGEVQIDLVPVVARILSDQIDQGLAVVGIDDIPFIDVSEDPEEALTKLSGALGRELPADFGKFTVMTETQLEELQQTARAADRLVWALLLGTFALAAATLATAPRRRQALLYLSIGTSVGLVVTMLLLRNLQDEVAGVAATAQGRDAVRVLTDSTLDSLRSLMLVALAVGLVVALAAYLAGSPAWFTRTVAAVRRAAERRPGGSNAERFVAAHYDMLRIGVAVVGVAVLAIFGITLLTVGIVAGLVLLTLWALAAARNNVVPEVAPIAAGSPRAPDEAERGG